MPLSLRIISMGLSICIFLFCFNYLIKKRLNENDSILWFVITFLCLIGGFFPTLVTKLANLVGIDYPPTLLFLTAIIVLIFIVFKCTVNISQLNDRVRELTSNICIMEHELKQIKKELESKQEQE